MILFIRDNELFEPRTKNYLEYFASHNIKYHAIGWNRDGTAESSCQCTFWERRARYGQGIANLPNKLLWMLFVAQEIIKRHSHISIIHACDYDCIFPALPLAKLFKIPIIFDVYDWSSTTSDSPFIFRLIERLQLMCYEHANYVIVCDQARLQQANSARKDILVLPNIPNIKVDFSQDVLNRIKNSSLHYALTLSYVGVFDTNRGIENLLSAVSSRPNIQLNIAGFGQLSPLVQQYATQYPNISYWGRVDYTIGQTIIKSSDLTVAMYYLSNPVHKYAAPNKYYESLALSVPVITTKNTAIGDKVTQYNTGFAIGDNLEALTELLDSSISPNIISEMRNNCTSVWRNKYSSFYNNFMNNTYTKMLNEVHNDKQL